MRKAPVLTVLTIFAGLAVASFLILRAFPGAAPVAQAADAAAKPPAAAKPKINRRYPVRMQPIRAQRVNYTLQALGTLEAQDVYRIPAAVSGIVGDVDFNEGSTVDAGRRLCRISPETYQFVVDKQKAIYDQAVANLADYRSKSKQTIEQAEISLAEAQRQVERRKSVTLEGAVAPEEIQQFQTRADLAQLALKAAQENAATGVKNLEAVVAEKKALWDVANDDLQKATVQAPITGVIEERLVTNGQYVAAGTTLARLVDRRVLKLRFKVPEQESAAVKVGDTATFTVPAWPVKTFQAQVYFLSNQVDPQSRVIDCFARVTEDLESLKPGFFASVNLVTGGNNQGIVIPNTGLLPTEKGFVAFVLTDLQWMRPTKVDGKQAFEPVPPGQPTAGAQQHGIARRRSVKVGLNVTGNNIEILEGLKDGEFLVTDGASALEEGYPVFVLPDLAAASAGHEQPGP